MAVAAGVAGVFADSTLIEPNRPQILRREIGLARWPQRLDGFTIALLSDFHFDPYFSKHPLEAAVEMVNGLQPDLIVLTGDFVSLPLVGNHEEECAQAAWPCAVRLRKMHARYGMWAALGNHDYFTDPDVVMAALRAHGVGVLVNESVPIEKDGALFWLGGVNDVLSGTADLEATFRRRTPGDATVLLAHEPDYADYVARKDIDLQLSGHSHGGQVRLPFVRPLYLPPMARKYIWGLFHIGGLTLYTNRGLGTVGLPVRLNCPPEITFLTLRCARA
jgi:uncharacterized protein